MTPDNITLGYLIGVVFWVAFSASLLALMAWDLFGVAVRFLRSLLDSRPGRRSRAAHD